MTRVSVTSDGATVDVVEVLVDVGAKVVVVEVLVDVVAGAVVEVVASNVMLPVEDCVPGAADDDVSDPDEHDSSISGATTSAHHHSRLVMVTEVSTRRDENAAITVRELLALDESTDLGEELGDVAHHAVLRPDLGGDAFELGPGHQHCGRVDR